MLIKINGVEIAKYPKEFTVTAVDIDGESTKRTSDGTLLRDRIAVKRQIEMTWNALKWSEVSSILQAMSAVFFDVYYPDPVTGKYETKTFYAGNRPCPMAISRNSELYWTGLKITLTEK